MFSSVFLFFDIGGGEIMLIMLVVLLLFGGEKLPQLARGLGKGIRDFKDASEGVKREITNQIDSFEAKKAAETNTANNTATVAETAGPIVVTTTTPASEAPVAHEPVLNTMPVANTIPVSEISSTAEVAPEGHSYTEPGHLKETPIEPVIKAHEEFKS